MVLLWVMSIGYVHGFFRSLTFISPSSSGFFVFFCDSAFFSKICVWYMLRNKLAVGSAFGFLWCWWLVEVSCVEKCGLQVCYWSDLSLKWWKKVLFWMHDKFQRSISQPRNKSIWSTPIQYLILCKYIMYWWRMTEVFIFVAVDWWKNEYAKNATFWHNRKSSVSRTCIALARIAMIPTA